MEMMLSLAAVVISLASILVSVIIYWIGIRREKKQATLDAINLLQEQVFDKINMLTPKEIREIAEARNSDAYVELSSLLARIEHFCLGANENIYDARIVERAATKYFIALHRKLLPLLERKQGNHSVKFYGEFEALVERVKKIDAQKEKKIQKQKM